MNAPVKITPAPVRKSILVNASQIRAFEVFTARFNSWWPRTHHIGAIGPKPGARLPGFAAPLVLSPLVGDPNTCAVHLTGALNICDIARGGPVVLGFLFTRGGGKQCEGSFDQMQRLRTTFSGVQFVGVMVAGITRRR